MSLAPQDAAEATAEVTEVPVIEATSEVAGLTESEVESEAFEVTFEKAVANALDIDPSQVRCRGTPPLSAVVDPLCLRITSPYGANMCC